jgi:hypothetical protein
VNRRSGGQESLPWNADASELLISCKNCHGFATGLNNK